MSRKRLVLITLPVVAALAAAGLAVAAVSSGAQAASATFTAASISNKHQATCSANGGDTYKVTVATYKGTAASTSDARLDGALRLRIRSVIDTATGAGRLDGAFGIKGSTGGVRGVVHAALSGSQATGLAQGQARNPGGRLIASFGSSFDPDTGFSSGLLGSGSSSAAGAVLSGAVCKAAGLHLHLKVKARGHRG